MVIIVEGTSPHEFQQAVSTTIEACCECGQPRNARHHVEEQKENAASE